MINLPEDNDNNNEDKKINIKPSGMMKVSSVPGGKRNAKFKGKNKSGLMFFLTNPAVTLSGICKNRLNKFKYRQMQLIVA